jgi:putative membrane protein
MPTPTKTRFVGALALATTLVLACGNNRRVLVRDPTAANEPAPQSAFHDPSVHGPHDQTATPPPSAPESPYQYPSAPGAALTPPPPAALPEPERKKPMYGEPAATGDRALAKTDKPLTDAQILGVAAAVDDGEVALADIATTRATAPAVKRFAEKMKGEHAAALQKTKALEAKTKIESADSDASTSVKDEVQRATRDLRAAAGDAFDRAYIDAEVKRHKDVLALVDQRLAPSAKNADVRSLIGGMRQQLADHLAKADEIREQLDPSATKRGQIKQPSDAPSR